MQSQPQEPSKVSDLYGAARTLFIQRVYTILGCQLLVTVFMTILSMTSMSFFRFQIENTALFFLAIVVCVVCQIWMFCCEGGRKYPQNIILTSFFTLAESYMVSFICAATGMQSGNSLVLMAALMTLAVVAGCTMYAVYTKEDYTTSSALIVVLSIVLLCLFVILMFTNSPFLQAVYCGIGVLLFGIYIVVDTQLIVGGRSAQLDIDDYFLGSMLLYIDIVTMFLYILQLLGLASSSSN